MKANRKTQTTTAHFFAVELTYDEMESLWRRIGEMATRGKGDPLGELFRVLDEVRGTSPVTPLEAAMQAAGWDNEQIGRAMQAATYG